MARDEEAARPPARPSGAPPDTTALYRLLVDSLDEYALIALDPEGHIATWNEGARHLLGYEEREVLGRHLRTLFTPEDRRNGVPEVELESGVHGEGFRGERWYVRKDGRRVRVCELLHRLPEGPDGSRGFAVFLREAAESAAPGLFAGGSRRTDFLAELAHELRNPLAPLRSGLHIMRRPDASSAMVQAARNMMERQLGHVVQLIDDLLDVTRLARGKLELHREPTDLATLVAAAVKAASPLVGPGGQELSLALPDQPLTVQADRARLTRVLAHLLENSARHTPAGGRIEVTARRAGDQAVVSVRDTGSGIARDELPTIFDMFARSARNPERAAGAGLGLGLTLAHGIVERHGGSMEARSEGPGTGSTFTVRLPIVRGAAAESPAATGKQAGAPPGARRSILVVDDNRDSAASLAMMLELLGHEVRIAHDGEEGVQLAATVRPDVIFMDVGMPRLDGFEATRRIRAADSRRDLKIVMLTGYGQAEDRDRSAEAGADGHLIKPVDPEEIERVLAGFEATLH